jgi:rRNA small subunit pseudouridine methyltransferase Nep1
VKRLLLVIVEAAVELVPRELLGHPAVRKHAARTGKDPSRMLLDRSYHHAAMRRLEDSAKRGRPDIPYHILLDAVDSPLYASGGLGLYVSTRDGMVLEVGERVRLPRSYHRFVGLLEDLYVKGIVRDSAGNVLLRMRRASLGELLSELSPDRAVLLRESGTPMALEELARELSASDRPLVGIGGFPAGDFSGEVLGLFGEQVSLGGTSYSASLLACRLIYEVEKALRPANA